MSTPEDKDLEEFLAGRSDLSRRYRSAVSREVPPADVSRAILAKARAAVETASTQQRPERKPRLQWAVPFALAASVLLTVAIYRQGGPPSDTDITLSKGTSVVESPAPVSAPQGDNAAERTVPEASFVAPGEPAVQRDGEARLQAEAAESPSVPRAVMAPAPPPAAALSSAATDALVARDESLESKSSQVLAESAAPVPVPAPAAAPPAPAARVQALSRSSGAPAANSAEAVRAPEVWLEEVRTLRAAGQGAKADEELKRFLEAYPGYFDRNPGIARP